MYHSELTKKADEAREAQKDIANMKKEAEHEKVIHEWLAKNPEIGVLNSGKFYKIVNGKTVAVKAFS